MDILKVLSRGTKPASRSARTSQPGLINLPSAGTRTNPQLFHDHVGAGRGTKRRRNEDAPKDESDQDASDMDFFAPKDSEKSHQTKTTPKAAEPEQGKRSKIDHAEAELLEEEECRRVLRSHRLKLTCLSVPAIRKSKTKKSKKAKTSAKTSAKTPLKEENRLLYSQPLTSFPELETRYGISSRLAANIARQGYEVPTEVQLASLPLLLQPELALSRSTAENTPRIDGGVDFMAVAPTGSGKTISFLIPAINNALQRRSGGSDHKKHVLESIVIAPTRELAAQIVNEGKKLAVGTGVKVVAMRKGMRIASSHDQDSVDETEGDESVVSDSSDEALSVDDDESEDSKPKPKPEPLTKTDILVTTPMLLLNFLSGGPGAAAKTLPLVKLLVLDEADVLLDPLFREQTTGIWSACTNPLLRLTFWSATMGSNIETLLTERLSARGPLPDAPPASTLIRLVVGLKDTAVPNITHRLVYTATEQGKLLALRQLLHPVSQSDSGPPLRPPFLVFTQTIERASALHNELKYDIPLAAGGSSRIAVLHASLSDSVRAGIMARFRAGEIWVLITTDVLSRGVDFAGVNGVVNYDVPGSSAAYVHRAGRTGRAGRQGGVAVTFYTKEDIPFVKSVANVIAASEKQAGRTAEDAADGAGVQKWLLDALPKVKKAAKKELKERGVEARRSGGKAKITSKSSYDRRKERNRREAIVHSRKKAAGREQDVSGDIREADGEWGGIDD